MILDLSFEQIMLNSPHFVFWKDKNSTYLGCNSNFALLAGLDSPDKVVGKTDYELWPNLRNEADIFRQGDIETMRGRPLTNAKESISNNNQDWVLLASKSPLVNKRHNTIGLFGIGIDITPKNTFKNTFDITKRQAECLNCLVRGMTAKQIARTLGLSHRTVEDYILNLKDKFKCTTKSDLIGKVFDLGFEITK